LWSLNFSPSGLSVEKPLTFQNLHSLQPARRLRCRFLLWCISRTLLPILLLEVGSVAFFQSVRIASSGEQSGKLVQDGYTAAAHDLRVECDALEILHADASALNFWRAEAV